MRNSLFVIALLFLSFPGYSDCTEQTTVFPASQATLAGITATSERRGQSFMPCETGEITAIHIKLDETSGNTYTGDVDLYLAVNPPDGMLISGAAYQRANITAHATSLTGILTFNLTTPFPVTMGTTYRMEFSKVAAGDTFNLDLDIGSSIYLNGVYYFATGGPTPTFDLNFSIDIRGNPIPTLSQWGLITLALLLLILGVTAVFQRVQINISS